jgi:ATP-dependent Lon protease
MENAMKILNECAYGLNDAKMQILQMIGQWIANPSAMGTAIAIKGPMGTGKTTLVKEGISKILNRQFVLMALGGATDGSVFDGSPYVYEGSGPGMIAKKLIETKEMNSCFLFDELDKVSDTEKGQEIIGILTHLTDTTQNSEFHDKYFADVDFDMSRALFIFSYNDESRVNPILKDRMYSIQTKGYTPKEKITIATNYLLPRIREQVNFKEDEVIIPDEVLEYIINTPGLTKSEDGVRNFKRCLEIIHTKLNLFRLVKSDSNILTKEINLKVTFPITVTKKDVDALIKNDEKQSQSILAMYC